MKPLPLTRLDIIRKLIHIALGCAIVAGLYFHYLSSWIIFWVLASLVIGSFIARLLPRRQYRNLVWILEKNAHDWPGQRVVMFLIGILLSLQLYDFSVALACICILALGDGVSGLVGPFGSIRSPLSQLKLVEGSLAGALCGGAAALLFVAPLEAFTASFVAMTFEAIEIRLNQKILDDNIVVPLAAGTTIVLLRVVMGGL